MISNPYIEVQTFGNGLVVEVRRNRQTREDRVHIFTVTAREINKFTIEEVNLSQSPRFAGVCKSGGPSCPIGDFERALRDYLLDNAEAECNGTSG